MTDLDRLTADYLVAAHEQAVRMRSLAGRAGPAELAALRLSAHRLRGSGQSFGFPEITRLAGRIEDLVVVALADGGPLDGPLAELCADLDGAVERARGGSRSPDAVGPARDG